MLGDLWRFSCKFRGWGLTSTMNYFLQSLQGKLWLLEAVLTRKRKWLAFPIFIGYYLKLQNIMDISSLQNGNTSRSTSLRILDCRDPSSYTSRPEISTSPRVPDRSHPLPCSGLAGGSRRRRQRRQGRPALLAAPGRFGPPGPGTCPLVVCSSHLEALTWEREAGNHPRCRGALVSPWMCRHFLWEHL